MTQRLLIAAWTVALAAAAASLALVLSSNHEDDPAARAALIVGLGLIFVGCGLVATVRRPENRIGVLMAIVGFFWFLSSLAEANSATVYTVGTALSLLVYGAFAQLILSFPNGQLETPMARAIVVLAYFDVTVVQWAYMLTRDHIGNASIHDVDWVSRTAWFGLFIGEPTAWNRGFGTDAIGTLKRFAFDEMNLVKLRINVFDYNDRAKHVLSELGFVQEGRLVRDFYREGAYHDLVIYSMFR